MEHPCIDDVPRASDEPQFFVNDDEHRCVWRGKEQKSVNVILRAAARVLNPWARDERDALAVARMERGKRIHKAIYLLNAGKLGTYDPYMEPYLDGWMAGCVELGIDSWLQLETPRFRGVDDKRGVWGIPDAIACGEFIVDFKSATDAQDGQDSYRIQVAGYCWITGTPRGVLVHVDATGAHRIEWITDEDHRRWKMALELTGLGESV